MKGDRQVRVTFLPDGRKVSVRPGTSLLEASRRARVQIRTRCGGLASCLMCKVSVDADNRDGLSRPGPAEQRKLGPLLEKGIRLSCQARAVRDVTVSVPEDPLRAAIRRQLAEQQADRDLW
jgi:uncharacterized 2Fe-2S/4Fe-4S cluster protein (DUF4445 family)